MVGQEAMCRWCKVQFHVYYCNAIEFGWYPSFNILFLHFYGVLYSVPSISNYTTAQKAFVPFNCWALASSLVNPNRDSFGMRLLPDFSWGFRRLLLKPM